MNAVRTTIGLFVAACLAATAVTASAAQQAGPAGQGYKVVGQWGKNGTGNSQFASTDGLTVDKDGSVYVADTDNNRVQVFSATGTFLRKWGSIGDGNGQFHGAEDVAIAPDGTIWVADYGDSRVQQFKPDGTFLTSIDIYGYKEEALRNRRRRKRQRPHRSDRRDLRGHPQVRQDPDGLREQGPHRPRGGRSEDWKSRPMARSTR